VAQIHELYDDDDDDDDDMLWLVLDNKVKVSVP
jgi:hypothetical protein